MIGLGLCSMDPVCWSYIQHQTVGKLMYTVTSREMESAAIALFTANLDMEFKFTTCLKHLLSQPRAQTFKSEGYRDSKLPINQAQCDHQAGWRNFSLKIFEKDPNICLKKIPTSVRRQRRRQVAKDKDEDASTTDSSVMNVQVVLQVDCM
jgi:hypothetical protein